MLFITAGKGWEDCVVGWRNVRRGRRGTAGDLFNRLGMLCGKIWRRPRLWGQCTRPWGELEQKRKTGLTPEEAAKELAGLDRILSVFGVAPAFEKVAEAPEDIRKMGEEREAARKAKDWKESDRLRDELAKHGWEVRDAAGSWRLVRKPGTP